MERPFRVALAALALLSSRTLANVIHVPADVPTVQQAIDAAAPGDTIVIGAGAPTAPITITKALRIVGDPIATFDNTGLGGFTQIACITLAGPGSGVVELVQVKTTGTTVGSFQAFQGSRISGGGFSELHVLDSTIEAPAWVALSGVGWGAAGISVTTPFVIVANSTVVGGSPGSDGSMGTPAMNGLAGIAGAPTVVLVNCSVTGGRGEGGNYFPGSLPPGLCPCAGIGGIGGPGVACTTLFRSGGSLAGGAGGFVLEAGLPKGQQPSGPPTTAASPIVLTQEITCSAAPALGTNWTITWSTTSASPVLLLSSFPVTPFHVPGIGWSFSDYTAAYFSGFVSSGTGQTMTFSVPNSPFLLGLEVVAQLWDPARELGGPLIRAVVP